jgi:DNA primase
VVRSAGIDAFEKHIHDAEAMSDSLFYKEVQQKTLETPERRAALREKFDKLIREIQSPEVQRYYRDLFHRRLDQLFWRLDRNDKVEKTNIAAPSIMPDGASEGERVLLGLLIDRPELLKENYEAIENVYLASEPHKHLCDALILASAEQTPSSPDWFYENAGEEYHHLLDLIYGRNAKGEADGHNFYRSFPAFHPSLAEHQDKRFAQSCLHCFIHEQYHKALKQDCSAAHQDYLSHYNNKAEEEKRTRWLKMKTLLEEDQAILFYELTEVSFAIDSLSNHMDYATSFALQG